MERPHLLQRGDAGTALTCGGTSQQLSAMWGCAAAGDTPPSFLCWLREVPLERFVNCFQVVEKSRLIFESCYHLLVVFLARWQYVLKLLWPQNHLRLVLISCCFSHGYTTTCCFSHHRCRLCFGFSLSENTE